MYLLVIALTAAVIIYLLHVMKRLKKDDYSALANRMARHSRSSLAVLKPCPLCGAMLERGERVHTVVFSRDPVDPSGRPRPPRIKESMVHMFGCPYCRPPEGTRRRTCPVCKRTIRGDGFAIARMFERDDKRKQVHVLGCTECRHGR